MKISQEFGSKSNLSTLHSTHSFFCRTLSIVVFTVIAVDFIHKENGNFFVWITLFRKIKLSHFLIFFYSATSSSRQQSKQNTEWKIAIHSECSFVIFFFYCWWWLVACLCRYWTSFSALFILFIPYSTRIPWPENKLISHFLPNEEWGEISCIKKWKKLNMKPHH